MKTFFLFFLFLLTIPATVVFSQDAGIKKYGNVAFADSNGKPTRVGFRIDGDKKVRVAKKSGEVIDG